MMKDKIDTRALENLLKAVKKPPVARLGVLGKKNSRDDSSSNASIGAQHEFGEFGLPIRSWLRKPIIDHLQKYLEKADVFTEDMAREILKKGSLSPWVAKLGILGEAIILEGFATEGFGQWIPSRMEYKKVHLTLTESTQLRNSVSSEVASGGY